MSDSANISETSNVKSESGTVFTNEYSVESSVIKQGTTLPISSLASQLTYYQHYEGEMLVLLSCQKLSEAVPSTELDDWSKVVMSKYQHPYFVSLQANVGRSSSRTAEIYSKREKEETASPLSQISCGGPPHSGAVHYPPVARKGPRLMQISADDSGASDGKMHTTGRAKYSCPTCGRQLEEYTHAAEQDHLRHCRSILETREAFRDIDSRLDHVWIHKICVLIG